jgi:sugar phosphate isomerase/epimerase
MKAQEFNTNHVPTDRAAQRGYDGIELALLRADGVDVPEMKRMLAVTRMEIPYISSGQVFAADRLYFTHPAPHVRESAVQRFIGMIRLAAEFGAKVNTCSQVDSKSRNR